MNRSLAARISLVGLIAGCGLTLDPRTASSPSLGSAITSDRALQVAEAYAGPSSPASSPRLVDIATARADYLGADYHDPQVPDTEKFFVVDLDAAGSGFGASGPQAMGASTPGHPALECFSHMTLVITQDGGHVVGSVSRPCAS